MKLSAFSKRHLMRCGVRFDNRNQRVIGRGTQGYLYCGRMRWWIAGQGAVIHFLLDEIGKRLPGLAFKDGA